VLEVLLTFLPVAALLTVTPGVATALVIRSAARGGRREALLTTAGNSIGVLAWAGFAAVGIAAAVAASAEAFTVIKYAGALVLVVLGIQSLRAKHADDASPPARGAPLRDGLLTSLANPKLAVFFAALFPQFVPEGTAFVPAAMAMAGLIVALDLVWYSSLAWGVARARRAFVEGPWLARAERLTGGVLVGLGLKLAFQRR
jgi:threonine/homoserine/homoserine lactone efflux protein